MCFLNLFLVCKSSEFDLVVGLQILLMLVCLCMVSLVMSLDIWVGVKNLLFDLFVLVVQFEIKNLQVLLNKLFLLLLNFNGRLVMFLRILVSFLFFCLIVLFRWLLVVLKLVKRLLMFCLDGQLLVEVLIVEKILVRFVFRLLFLFVVFIMF